MSFSSLHIVGLDMDADELFGMVPRLPREGNKYSPAEVASSNAWGPLTQLEFEGNRRLLQYQCRSGSLGHAQKHYAVASGLFQDETDQFGVTRHVVTQALDKRTLAATVPNRVEVFAVIMQSCIPAQKGNFASMGLCDWRVFAPAVNSHADHS